MWDETQIVYVAGPYNADDQEGVQANKDRAKKRARKLADLSEDWLYPFVPHTATGWVSRSSKTPDSTHLWGMLKLLESCDAVWFEADDKTGLTPGQIVELDLALQLGKRLYWGQAGLVQMLDEVRQRREWLDGNV